MDESKFKRLWNSLSRYGKRKFKSTHRSKPKDELSSASVNFGNTHRPSCRCRGTGVVDKQQCVVTAGA